MKQYKLFSINNKTNTKNSDIFFEIVKKPNFFNSYLEIEKNYINIIYDIIKSQCKFILEIEYLYSINKTELAFYSEDEHNLFQTLLNFEEGSKLEIKNEDLKKYIKFILREHLRAQILNSKDEVLFGYINDFECLVYSDNLKIEQIKNINDMGFIIEEFYFSFDFEE